MSSLTRPLWAAALAASTVVTLAVPAPAAEEEPTTTSSSSSTTPSSTTSRTEPDDGSSTTTTTEPASSSTTSSSSSSTTTTTLDPDVVPPEMQARIDAYPRTPARSTADLVAALQAAPGAALTGGFGRFPVGGVATWSHDWLFPRHEPSLHFHEGTDVFADRGTPVLAPAAGTASVTTGAVGGLAVKVTQPDGTVWYLAHLDEALVDDAAGGSPHVHVEVWPHGGEPLDPKPILDVYAAEALARAPAFVLTNRMVLRRSGPS